MSVAGLLIPVKCWDRKNCIAGPWRSIKVPEYWEISANNTSGKVHNMDRERARIFYAEPFHKRLVRVVDWMDEKGVVRYSDHYNKYGALYARTIFNNKGKNHRKQKQESV